MDRRTFTVTAATALGAAVLAGCKGSRNGPQESGHYPLTPDGQGINPWRWIGKRPPPQPLGEKPGSGEWVIRGHVEGGWEHGQPIWIWVPNP